MHDYKNAQMCFQTALKSAPENVMILNNLGLNLAIQGSLSQGIDQLRRAHKISADARLKNNIHLLESIANNEQSITVLVSKLDSSFPAQKSALTVQGRHIVTNYAQLKCS
ncbi:MAG: hypothetical protein ACHP6H_04360 [Legionellales bacterium]